MLSRQPTLAKPKARFFRAGIFGSLTGFPPFQSDMRWHHVYFSDILRVIQHKLFGHNLTATVNHKNFYDN